MRKFLVIFLFLISPLFAIDLNKPISMRTVFEIGYLPYETYEFDDSTYKNKHYYNLIDTSLSFDITFIDLIGVDFGFKSEEDYYYFDGTLPNFSPLFQNYYVDIYGQYKWKLMLFRIGIFHECQHPLELWGKKPNFELNYARSKIYFRTEVKY